MVGITAVMVTSFKGTYAGTTVFSAPVPMISHCQPTPQLETPGHSRQVLLSLLWGHCSFLLTPGVHKALCPPRVCFPTPVQVLVALW